MQNSRKQFIANEIETSATNEVEASNKVVKPYSYYTYVDYKEISVFELWSEIYSKSLSELAREICHSSYAQEFHVYLGKVATPNNTILDYETYLQLPLQELIKIWGDIDRKITFRQENSLSEFSIEYIHKVIIHFKDRIPDNPMSSRLLNHLLLYTHEKQKLSDFLESQRHLTFDDLLNHLTIENMQADLGVSYQKAFSEENPNEEQWQKIYQRLNRPLPKAPEKQSISDLSILLIWQTIKKYQHAYGMFAAILKDLGFHKTQGLYRFFGTIATPNNRVITFTMLLNCKTKKDLVTLWGNEKIDAPQYEISKQDNFEKLQLSYIHQVIQSSSNWTEAAFYYNNGQLKELLNDTHSNILCYDNLKNWLSIADMEECMAQTGGYQQPFSDNNPNPEQLKLISMRIHKNKQEQANKRQIPQHRVAASSHSVFVNFTIANPSQPSQINNNTTTSVIPRTNAAVTQLPNNSSAVVNNTFHHDVLSEPLHTRKSIFQIWQFILNNKKDGQSHADIALALGFPSCDALYRFFGKIKTPEDKIITLTLLLNCSTKEELMEIWGKQNIHEPLVECLDKDIAAKKSNLDYVHHIIKSTSCKEEARLYFDSMKLNILFNTALSIIYYDNLKNWLSITDMESCMAKEGGYDKPFSKNNPNSNQLKLIKEKIEKNKQEKSNKRTTPSSGIDNHLTYEGHKYLRTEEVSVSPPSETVAHDLETAVSNQHITVINTPLNEIDFLNYKDADNENELFTEIYKITNSPDSLWQPIEKGVIEDLDLIPNDDFNQQAPSSKLA